MNILHMVIINSNTVTVAITITITIVQHLITGNLGDDCVDNDVDAECLVKWRRRENDNWKVAVGCTIV